MASYFLHVKTFARGKGSKVTKAAAYRAGARIRDERTSAVFNYTSRTDVAHAEIVLPAHYAGRPPELTPAQRAGLVRTFAQELADRHRNAVDFAIKRTHKSHAPKKARRKGTVDK